MISPVVVQKMRSNLKGKHFLKLADFTKSELMDLIRYTVQIKNMQKSGESHPILKGKTLAMIFEKSSTRTRVSFETGMYQLGGHALFLNKNDLQIGNGETIADTAKVLSRYVDGIMIRTYKHKVVEELAENASIPIINGLTDDYHPCQVLADLVTIYEKKGTFEGLKLAFIGDGNNMAQSLLVGCAIMGIDCTIASPSDSQVKAEIFNEVVEKAAVSGAKIEQTDDPFKAAANADLLYTDVWASMGWNGDLQDRKKSFMKYQVNEALVQVAKEDFLFLHCLPAHREEEVTASIIDGDHSVVFDQAENRLHAQKAILASLL